MEQTEPSKTLSQLDLRIPVVVSESNGYVHSSEDARTIREKYRIVGGLVGSLPQQPMQNSFLGLPLVLLPEEVSVLYEIGAIFLLSPSQALLKKDSNLYPEFTTLKEVQWKWPYSEHEKIKLAVFRDLWQRGYFLSPGLKFGGDYLVYPGDPMRYHSHYIATVTGYDSQLTGQEIVALGRVGTNVKKSRLLCSFDSELSICIYNTLSWAGF